MESELSVVFTSLFVPIEFELCNWNLKQSKERSLYVSLRQFLPFLKHGRLVLNKLWCLMMNVLYFIKLISCFHLKTRTPSSIHCWCLIERYPTNIRVITLNTLIPNFCPLAFTLFSPCNMSCYITFYQTWIHVYTILISPSLLFNLWYNLTPQL